jgi:hypothetical protein
MGARSTKFAPETSDPFRGLMLSRCAMVRHRSVLPSRGFRRSIRAPMAQSIVVAPLWPMPLDGARVPDRRTAAVAASRTERREPRVTMLAGVTSRSETLLDTAAIPRPGAGPGVP